MKSQLHKKFDQRQGRQLQFRQRGCARDGFSLVEVSMALGIVGVAMVSLIGLLPVSYTSFHASTRSLTSTQLAQRIFADMQQTDFTNLPSAPINSFHDLSGAKLEAPYSNKVFDVEVEVLSVGLPCSSAVSSTNNHLKRIVVKVAENPGGQPNAFSNAAIPVSTFCATVSDMQ